LLISQLLTLYTTPVIYIWFDRLAARFSKEPAPAKEKQERGGTLGANPLPAK
jgi:multidrug efflux pump